MFDPIRGINLLAITIGLGAVLLSTTPSPASPARVSSATAPTVAEIEAAGHAEFYTGLPVAKVATHTASHAWATAIFVPQFHQSPGTKAADPKNDRGEQTQQEIYQILHRITDQTPTRLVMVEGEAAGDVDPHKTAALAAQLAQRDQFARLTEETVALLKEAGYSPAAIADIQAAAAAELAAVDREHILRGGAENLAARGAPLIVVGAEEPTTQEQSRQLVRDHLYLKDRLAALKKSPSRQLTAFQPDGLLSLPQHLLQRRAQTRTSSASSLDHALRSLSAVAAERNDQSVRDALARLRAAHDALRTPPARVQTAQAPAAPARADNPYNHITNPETLTDMLQRNEAQIEQVVIDQRNTETARNFSQALRRHNQTVGIIQYGAGHTDGMVKELNQAGISVIVVTPSEVARHAIQ